MTIAGALSAAVERIMRRVDYHALYPARVVTQHADGSLDLVPDSTRAPSCQAVPVRTLRGLSVEVAAGARVLLGYEEGDPARPYAALWEPGAVTRLRVNGASTRAAREGDDVTAGAGLAAWMASVTAKVNTLPGTPTPTAPSVLGTISDGSDVVRIP